MAVSTDIIRAWRAPREIARKLLSMGQREDRALAFLMGGCLLLFVAQLPALARAAQFDPSIPIDARIQEAFFAWLFIVPLFAYVFALLLWALIRVITMRARPYETRLAVFWSLLATAPASLLFGLCRGFLGEDHPGTLVVGGVLAVGFVMILFQTLREGLSHA